MDSWYQPFGDEEIRRPDQMPNNSRKREQAKKLDISHQAAKGAYEAVVTTV